MKFFILCPPNVNTGGPECLHQFAHSLIKKGFEASMAYFPYTEQDPVVNDYKKYNIPFIKLKKISDLDIPSYCIVFYEIITFQSFKLNKAIPIIYWLSVNFSDLYFYEQKSIDEIKQLSLSSYDPKTKEDCNIYLCHKNNTTFYPKKTLHIAQSKYAVEYLKAHHCKSFLIREPMSSIFYGQQINCERNPIILYNPSKGIENSRSIIEYCKDLKFIPLKGFSKEEIINLFLTSKLYIDFGSFPGADRLPKEAILCGCHILIGKTGAASYAEDFPIEDYYKENYPLQLNKIKTKIYKILELETPYANKKIVGKTYKKDLLKFNQGIMKFIYKNGLNRYKLYKILHLFK